MSHLSSFDRQSVEDFARKFEDLFYEGDGAGMAAYYTENARLMGEGINPIQGRAGIESFWQSACAHAKILHMKRKINVDDIEMSPELSYAVCTLVLQFQTPDGQIVDKTVKDITIWRRLADGKWQIEVDISNPNPPARA
jgi:uncharacterized protein (TIGR02246 family)